MYQLASSEVHGALFWFAGGKKGPHQIQGIGAGIIPELLDIPMLDRIMTVHSNEGLDMVRRLSLQGVCPLRKACWLASPQVLHLLLLFR
jgi:cysteine synthase